jgi:glucose/arabinose dehydrogenase
MATRRGLAARRFAAVMLAAGLAAAVLPEAAARPVTDLIDTNLLKLRRTTINAVELENAILVGQGTIAAADNRIMLADRGGRFFEIDLRGEQPRVRGLPFSLGLNEKALRAFAGEKAVVDVALVGVLKLAFLHGGKQLAASYTKWDPDRHCVSLRVAVRPLPDNWRDPTSEGWRIVFESEPCLPISRDGRVFAGHQAGGRIAEKEPGVLVLTLGDFEFDGMMRKPDYVQDPEADYGKTVLIDTKTGEAIHLTSGHRNPQGLAIDRSGRIWEAEHGPRGGDELNLLRPGANYGWPLVTLGTNYGRHTWPLSKVQSRHDGYEWPVYAWVPSIAVCNLIAVEGFAPEWEGDLLVASLLGAQLRRLRLHDGRVVYDEPIPMGDRLRDIDQLADGRLVLWTDSATLILLESAGTMDGK